MIKNEIDKQEKMNYEIGKTRDQNEQQQKPTFLKELSEIKQENNQLKIELSKQQQKLQTNFIQESTINEVKRLFPHKRVHNCTFTSPSQNITKETRISYLPDVSSNRQSINKISFPYSKKPPSQHEKLPTEHTYQLIQDELLVELDE